MKFKKVYIYSDPQLINVTLGLTFRLKTLTSLDSMSFSNNTFNRIWKSSNFDFDTCITQLEAETNWNLITDTVTSHCSRKSNINLHQITIIAKQLYLNKIYDEAMEFYEQLLQIYQNNNKIISINVNNTNIKYSSEKMEFVGCEIANVESEAPMLLNIANCYFKLSNYADALTFLNRALDIEQNTALIPDKDRNIASTLFIIGNCHNGLCNYADALKFLNRALDIYQNTALIPDKNRNLASTLSNIGVCHSLMCNYADALTFVNRALDIKQNTALNPDKDREIASTLSNIGNCHRYMCNYADALTFLNRALDIFQNAVLNPDNDRNLQSRLAILKNVILICATTPMH